MSGGQGEVLNVFDSTEKRYIIFCPNIYRSKQISPTKYRMEEEKIVVVGGYVGCGKTSWIYQQIASQEKAFPKCEKKILYLKAGTGKVRIDQKRISIDLPAVKVFGDGEEVDFINELESADVAYIELGSNLGLGYIDRLLNDLPYYPIGILPPGYKRCKWHSWAKEVLTGAAIKVSVEEFETFSVATTGKVISGNKFNKFWNNITSHSYGKVIRAKGIFHLEDGNIIYADFVDGVPCIEFLDLNLSHYLHGEPKCFSGLEIVGSSLHKDALSRIVEKIYVAKFSVL